MAKGYIHRLSVRCRTRSFPLDMLRYDSCYPASETDAHDIGDNLVGLLAPLTTNVVTVEKRTRVKQARADAWTLKRWRSWGCEIVDVHAPTS